MVAALLLGGFVSGAFAGIATANSDHFELAHLIGRVDKIEATAVHKDVWVSESTNTAKRLDRIEAQLDRLNNTLDTWKVTQ